LPGNGNATKGHLPPCFRCAVRRAAAWWVGPVHPARERAGPIRARRRRRNRPPETLRQKDRAGIEDLWKAGGAMRPRRTDGERDARRPVNDLAAS
jgi:hypothetical protein